MNLDIGDILNVSRTFDLPIAETVERLEHLGLTVPAMPTPPSLADLGIVSRDLDSVRPWLRRDHPVPPHHLMRAHWRFGMPREQVAERLVELGYEVVIREQEPEDYLLLTDSGRMTNVAPFDPVTLGGPLSVGRTLSMPILRVAERLRELGIEVADIGEMIRSALAQVPGFPEAPS